MITFMQKNESYGLHWFRRDLRVMGNPSLEELRLRFGGKVLGVFFFDSQFLQRPDFAPLRFAFFLNTLKELKSELQRLGSDLLILDQGPEKGFERLFAELKKGSGLPECVSFNRDYEPFARARDQKISRFLKEQEIELFTARDHLIIEPHELAKDDGTFYKVFTPFARKWLELAKIPQISARLNPFAGRPSFSLTWKKMFAPGVTFEDSWEKFYQANEKKVSISLPPAGHRQGMKVAQDFAKKIDRYKKERDFPQLAAGSGLSCYFKNGSVSTAQVLHMHHLLEDHKVGPQVFLKEIIWREFYYHLLFHCPWLEKEEMQTKYRKLAWQNNESFFAAWCEGRTGYPLVDAGMRELATTGKMHNRIRMVVASFLTKDLLIDWRWGERYFMQKLLDGDLAANNGGWQWAASTGADAQPYFRIFHPIRQSERFDPQGDYIRTFVPELAHLSAKDIHFPAAHLRPPHYPPPIVDHSVQRLAALKLFRNQN